MQEIGTWTTAEGTVSATLMLESDVDEVGGQELPNWLSGAMTGALGGAATGSVAGPLGALAGAATGAVLGGATAASAPKPPATPPAPGTPTSSPAPTTSSAPAGAAQSTAIQALQQFATAIPALIQVVATSNTAKTGKASELSDAEAFAEFVSDENLS
ncbi:MAG: hypothetical protein ABIS29_15875, partial [Vicinamibacterales bacterium]